MKTNNFRFILVSSVLMLAGCASVAVTDEAIEKNTAFALGVERGTFTISDRENSGIKTTYSVKTKSGQKYSCYVTGTVSIIGRIVSDPICNKMSKSGKVTKTKNNSTNCNDLLRSAGKCS